MFGVAFLLLFGAPQAQAAEVQFDGFYQMRARLFDTLSLDHDITGSEGLSWYAQHRLWLRPKFFLSEQVAVFAEIRALDNVVWGDGVTQDAITVPDGPIPIDLLSDDLQPGITATDGVRNPVPITLSRAWGEVHTKVGTFSFGRQPLHWGLGIWQNDGLGYNTDHGDSADRIAFETMIQKSVWLRVAADIHTEGLIQQTDDTTSFSFAGAYRTERMEGGVQLMYRHRAQEDARFDLFVVDGTFDLAFGPIGLAGEVTAQLGNGDLANGVTNVNLTAVGAVIDAGVHLEKLQAGIEAGIATGDADPSDNKIKTFTFDRDFNTGFMLFEQPMPALATTTPSGEEDARTLDAALTSDALSNAVFLRPRIGYQPVRGLWVEGSLMTARVAKAPASYKAPERRTYGHEIDVTVKYTGIEHFTVAGTFGAFIPGTFFKNYSDDTFQGFKAPAIGGQLVTRIDF